MMYRESSTSDSSADDAGEARDASPGTGGKGTRAARTADTRTARGGAASTYSFRDLCLVHYDEMVRFARRLTVDDPMRADDIVQDSMIKAMKAWDRWQPQGDPVGYARAWLYKIVNTTYLKSMRSKRCAERAVGRDVARACNPDMEVVQHSTGIGAERYNTWDLVAPVEPESIGDEVAAALGMLSIDHREVVMLRYVSGLECEEIAIALGVPKNTVFTRLARARAVLERTLKNYAKKEYGIARQVTP